MFDFPSENCALQRNALRRTGHNLTEKTSPYITEITNWFLLSQKNNIIPSAQTNNCISTIFNWEDRPEHTAAVLKIPTRNSYVCLFLFWFFQWKCTLITWAINQNIHLQIFIPFRLFCHPVDFCHAINPQNASLRQTPGLELLQAC